MILTGSLGMSLTVVNQVYAETDSEWISEDGLVFEYCVKDDDTVMITAYPGNVEQLIFPQYIDGKQVTEIKNKNGVGYRTNYDLKSVVLPEGLTVIGDSAFYRCMNLESVYMPDTVTRIGDYAFYLCCNALKEITLSKNLEEIGWYAFSCSRLESIVIPEGTKKIGPMAFGLDWCAPGSYLKEVVLPDSLEYIGFQAFKGAYTLTSEIQLPSKLTYLGSGAFAYTSVCGDIIFPAALKEIEVIAFRNTNINSVTLEEGITVIGEAAFKECENLTYADLPDSLTTIEYDAFYMDTQLEVTIPKNVSYVGGDGLNTYTFAGVKSFDVALENQYFLYDDGILYSKDMTKAYCSYDLTKEKIELPDTVTTVDRFSDMPALKEIILPDSVTSIGISAFSSNEKLETVRLSKNLTEIPDLAFYNCSNLEVLELPLNITRIGIAAFQDCVKLESINIPDSVTEIGNYAFQHCRELSGITLSAGLQKLGKGAFNHTGIKEVKIPDGITELNKSVFSQCFMLSVVELPKGLKSIDAYAFYDCNRLDEIDLPKGLESIGHAALSGTAITHLEIPDGVKKLSGYICDSVTSVWMPESLEDIESSCFWNDSKEVVIYGYAGSSAEEFASAYCYSFKSVESNDCGGGNYLEYSKEQFEDDVTSQIIHAESTDKEYKSEMYNISFTGQDGSDVQPQGTVKVTLACPAGYNASECKIYFNDGNGNFVKKNVFCNENSLTFWTDTAGTYVLTEADLVCVEKPLYYRVNFYDGDEDISESVVRGGDTAIAPELEKECYSLSWDRDLTNVQSDFVTYAVWTENHQWNTEYTIDKYPTKTEEGSKSIHCSQCDTIKSGSSVVIPVVTPAKNGVYFDENGEPHYYENNVLIADYTGMAEDSTGKIYWFDFGIAAKDKQVYDPAADAWYWFDADGSMAVDKDVYVPESNENRENGKWVRYDAYGRMVKGEDYRYGGWYYFDPITGEMIKGFHTAKNGCLYYYDPITGQKISGETVINGEIWAFEEDGAVDRGWYMSDDGYGYWYEGGKRQGTEGRGKEIYDPWQNEWYWLDAVDGGRKAVSKDVYQESNGGKWVRYNAYGAMIKGWDEQDGKYYYFDKITGAMQKGWIHIEGVDYYFDEITGILSY